MSDPQYRELSLEERAFLEAVAARLPAESGGRLARDISIARVAATNDFLAVDLPEYERPEYRGHHNLPIEGEMRSVDGGLVHVLVNIDQNERLLEVEFVHWEASSSVVLDWLSLKVIERPPLANAGRPLCHAPRGLVRDAPR